MQLNDSLGRTVRIRQLYRHDAFGLLVVPLAHAVAADPLPIDELCHEQ